MLQEERAIKSLPEGDQREAAVRSEGLPNLSPSAQSPAAAHRNARIALWDGVARGRGPRGASAAYHQRLADIYSFLIVPNQRVLEIGLRTRGLARSSTRPAEGVGVDFSGQMLERARVRSWRAAAALHPCRCA